ncbi:T9SS type A sorting domain-containing protein [Flavobacterium sp. KACC 22758]|uniref:T9SS type A sorting domain-containing protein n=1 Tax=Flavobacterium sp. KACC 22758 TaxID=3025667 RepID=UPI0023670AAA|nr:T9SS type A sorting domain-containing protein [Flavobacterium sp. KACC 22758]WDF59330.1 T9SS type A sorting domain-containing protein [Flavobacterium sp. KACC 22758]
MKKITLLVLVFISSVTTWSQTYKFHTLQDLGPNIEIAISAGCAQTVVVGPNRDVNLNQSFKLEVGKVYKSDLILGSTSGSRYYKVLYAVDYYLDKGSDIDEPAPFELIPDLCNSLSWKYIRPILLGATLEEAQANYCSNLTANTIREKVNVKTQKPLSIGDVYFMNFGKGANYYLITGSSIEAGDSEYQLDPTNGSSTFSRTTLNCPKPDLQAIATDFGGTTKTTGANASVIYSIKNIGGRAFAPSHCLIYFSKGNSVLSSDDILIKDVTIDPLNPNESKYGVPSIIIPANISSGTYYVIIQLTNSEDINNSNNIISSLSSFTINQTTTPTGKPDLVIDPANTIIFSNCFDCSAALSDLGNKRHTINNQSGIINLQAITIKNIGSTASTPATLQFYLSTDGILDAADIKSTASSVSIAAINPGSSITVSKSIFSSDFGGLTVTGNRNILMSVDDSKTNTESNENNNITVIPVTFVNPFAKTVQSNVDVQDSIQPYSINVYNFEGQKVLTKEVKSIEEENQSLDSLKSGIYIIKSKNETRKVLK